MATTNPQSLKLSEADTTPMRVYRGSKKVPKYNSRGGKSGEADEYFYTDSTGKPIEGAFDPKKYSVIGDIINGVRTPYDKVDSPLPDGFPKFGPSYTGPMARTPELKSKNTILPFNDKPRNPMDFVRKSFPQASPPKPITPADVNANAAIPAPQKSIAEEQADYIRKRGGRTAVEADTEFESNLRKDYSEATGFDINTAEGRRKSFQAALQRGGHADAMARNLRAGKYAYLDPNSDAGMKARDTAYQKAFGPQGEFDKGIRAGVNPLTGQYKATLDGPAYGSKELYDTFRGAEDEATDYADNAINAALNPEPTFSWEQPNFDAAADAIRLRGGNPTQQQAAPNPLQASSDAAQGRIRDAFVTGTSQPEASKNIMPAFDKLDASLKTAADAVRNIGRDTWTPEKGGYKGGVWYSAADSEPEAGGNYGTPRLFDTWTPQAGGRFNGVNMSRADSEPQAGGNYGTPDLIRRMTNTWTPQAGGMYNGQHMSPADSEPQAGGNYGRPLLLPSTTRPISSPSRASILGARKRPITPWQGYGDQM